VRNVVRFSFVVGFVASAMPALADEVNSFDLANVSGSEVSLPASTVAEMPSPSFGAPKEEPVAEETTVESSSPISGGVDVLSKYCLADAVCPTPGPVVQPWLSFNLGGGFSVNGWASKNLSPKHNVGNEVDAGLKKIADLGNGVEGRVVYNHFFLLGGVPDMEEVTVGVSKNGFDLSASFYPWGGGLQDGFRVTAKKDFDIAPKLSASVGAVYETGMEADDTFVALAGLTYDLGRGFSAKVNAYIPHKGESRFTFGIGWGF